MCVFCLLLRVNLCGMHAVISKARRATTGCGYVFLPQRRRRLWKGYSTEAVIHTMEVVRAFPLTIRILLRSRLTALLTLEYPMITFNGPRTTLQDDGSRTYSMSKRFLLGAFQEIGRIYFPMIVNSDERQWTWMDEGLNSFLMLRVANGIPLFRERWGL